MGTLLFLCQKAIHRLSIKKIWLTYLGLRVLVDQSTDLWVSNSSEYSNDRVNWFLIYLDLTCNTFVECTKSHINHDFELWNDLDPVIETNTKVKIQKALLGSK